MLFVLLPGGTLSVSRRSWRSMSSPSCSASPATRPAGSESSRRPSCWPYRAIPREPVLGALLLYRLCYYFLPFVLALALLGAYEILNRLPHGPERIRSGRYRDPRRRGRSLTGRVTPAGACPKLGQGGPLQLHPPMSDPADLPPDAGRQSATRVRDAAWRGAVVPASCWWSWPWCAGFGDAWLLLWAAVAVLAGFLVAGPKRSLGAAIRPQPEPSPRLERRRGGAGPYPGSRHPRRPAGGGASRRMRPPRRLLPPSSSGHPLSFALRSPDVLDGIQEVLGTGRAAPGRICGADPDRADLRGADRPAAARAAGDAESGRVSSCSSATSPRPAVSRACGPISSPMPATSCARRWPPCSASSRPCKARPATTPWRGSGSWRSCGGRPIA